MTNEHQKEDGRTPDLVERLRTVTAMINMGEKVSLIYEVGLIETAATEIERLRAKLAEAEKDMAGVYVWLREPDWSEEFSLSDWLRRKPSPASFRAAAEWVEKNR
ncbi:hypothetical protein [Nitratireductor sp. StC3]|uniref:hypothetical protein n=1 Tax=Nitratireductor sp. StC3 TaxID=2126741 RepID=UPI000D0DDFC5|nr:hypothetical protein [Nitratireductor sp. StC3]PSM18258.1 hypothetical protein C7T96_10340 [Nitratireductor sp. StC3]